MLVKYMCLVVTGVVVQDSGGVSQSQVVDVGVEVSVYANVVADSDAKAIIVDWEYRAPW